MSRLSTTMATCVCLLIWPTSCLAQDKMPGNAYDAQKWLLERGQHLGLKDGKVVAISLGLGNVTIDELAVFPELKSLQLELFVSDDATVYRPLAKLKSLIDLHVNMGSLSPEALKYIAATPNLESLTILRPKSCPSLASLASCKTLTKLDISNARDIDFDSLQAFANHDGLKELRIEDVSRQFGGKDSNSFLTDEHLKHISNLKSLESLSIPRGYKITDAGLGHLAQCPKLKRLKINFDRVKGLGLVKFKDSQLTALELRCDAIAPDALNAISKMTNLERLALHPYKVVPRGALKLDGSVDTLTQLELSGVIFEGEELSILKGLQELQLSDCSGLAKSGLSELPNLATLNIIECVFRQEEIEAVAQLPKLEQFGVYGTRVRSVWLEPLSNMGSLKDVTFASCKFLDDKAIEIVARCPSLMRLHLSQLARPTDQSMKVLSNAKRLKELHLHSLPKITLEGFKQFPSTHPLNSLRLERMKGVTAAGFKSLSHLENLKSFRMSDLDLTNEQISALGTLKSLEVLVSSRSHTHQQQPLVNEVIRSLPNLIINQ